MPVKRQPFAPPVNNGGTSTGCDRSASPPTITNRVCRGGYLCWVVLGVSVAASIMVFMTDLNISEEILTSGSSHDADGSEGNLLAGLMGSNNGTVSPVVDDAYIREMVESAQDFWGD
jgi:hypothetical protein